MSHEPAESQEELDRVPIHDNGEPLVDFLALCPDLRFARDHPVFEFPRVHLLRQSVAAMLCRATEVLPPGVHLRIVEGYRPLAVQRAMYRHSLERARSQHPDWSPSQIEIEAGRYSAPPDAKTPPPHVTGGAVDLELVDEDGNRLDFSSPFDIHDLRQAAMHAPGLSEEARRNRVLLREILEPTGLTFYVDEWWHWSYGDNGWALRVGAPHALYDRLELPSEANWVGDLSKLPQDDIG